MKKSVLLLLLPSIFWLTPGSALAEVNVQTGNVRVHVGNDQGVKVRSRPEFEESDPWGWFPLRNYWPFESWFARPQKQSLGCQTNNVRQENTQTSNSGDGVSYTYSSSSTQTCN